MTDRSVIGPPPTTPTGVRLETLALGQYARGGTREVLREVSLHIAPGQVTAIAGSSGAGKTTLLETLAGIRRPASGRVLHDGADPAALRSALGFVPQDDIIHRELALARTLEYAARLRLPANTSSGQITATVTRALETLGLTERARQRVGSLSGGERKRASIAVELLTRPRVLFLDEPTSGLDPATGAGLMAALRQLAERGTTIVLTTHTPADLAHCDQVVFLSPDGRPAYAGPPETLPEAFRVRTVEEVYGTVAAGARNATSAESTAESAVTPPQVPAPGRALGPVAQWALLTRRSAEILLGNRLALAIVAGSPLMIVAMFAMLFKPGAFDPASPSPGSSAMILFWIAFGCFFFGLTYGLLQICTELPVVRRERLTVLRLGPYVLSKLTLLLPVLAAADALLLAVLRALDRLPSAHWGIYGSLFTTTVLASAAALALGLLASAAVAEPSQATLTLPMLCFPQVLFSGAFVPVPQMAGAGRALSYAMTNRWSYEALGSGLGLENLWAHGRSPLGPPLLASYGDTFGHPASLGWAILAGFTVACLAGAWAVLARRCRRAGAGPS